MIPFVKSNPVRVQWLQRKFMKYLLYQMVITIHHPTLPEEIWIRSKFHFGRIMSRKLARMGFKMESDMTQISTSKEKENTRVLEYYKEILHFGL